MTSCPQTAPWPAGAGLLSPSFPWKTEGGALVQVSGGQTDSLMVMVLHHGTKGACMMEMVGV